MKRITIKSQEWGDPYPCGDINSIKIGKEEIGTIVGGDVDDIRQVVRNAYLLGVKNEEKNKSTP